jgi:hypothetical protein
MDEKDDEQCLSQTTLEFICHNILLALAPVHKESAFIKI